MGTLKSHSVSVDYAIIGGGLAGVCGAITAARGGNSVALVQDRPVLGGNASSEVRLWALGATSHMGNNNRWSREGGVLDEILTENLYRNPEGNPVIFDTVLFDFVQAESRISLFLNTAMDSCQMQDKETIKSVRAFNAQNETEYIITAAMFCDCTGDGTLGFLSGADFIVGKDDISRQDALQYPESFGELLGSTIFFYTKDTGVPVKYISPDFALKDISKIKRLDRISSKTNGCDYWWIEWTGTMDTIHDSEEIKVELWRIVYGIWNHIKNSGKFPDVENYTLEWVGSIPGKRESRRLVGQYTISQQDVVDQTFHKDAVSYGGWALDHHPSQGVYSDFQPCFQWHSKGIYSIPFRAMYSANIVNLMMGGRLISTSRAAFGSTRVMMTGAHNAQATGAASVICKRLNILPRDIPRSKKTIQMLQQYLLRDGQFIPGLASVDKSINKALHASLSVSSEFFFTGFAPNGDWYVLDNPAALLVPLKKGRLPSFALAIKSRENTQLDLKIMRSKKAWNYTPEVVLEHINIAVTAGSREYFFELIGDLDADCYVFFCFGINPSVKVRRSQEILTGVMTVYNKFNPKVAKSASQIPPDGTGVDSFEFWTPYRRPQAQNLAFSFSQDLALFSPINIMNGYHRPYIGSNAWIPDKNDENPSITLEWNSPQNLSKVLLFFDTDHDFAMESVQFKHPESVLPQCVNSYRIYDNDTKTCLYSTDNNHQARNMIALNLTSRSIRIQLKKSADIPLAVFGLQCW